METPNFLIWAIVVFGIAGFAITVMANAYRSKIAVPPFPNAALDHPAISLSEDLMTAFSSAVDLYNDGNYRGAIAKLTPVVAQEPNCAEAWHNIGLAYANLGDRTKATKGLLQATEAYGNQQAESGIDRIKKDLKILKAQR